MVQPILMESFTINTLMSILEEEYRYSDIVTIFEIYLKEKVMKTSIQNSTRHILNRDIDIYAKALYILVIC